MDGESRSATCHAQTHFLMTENRRIVLNIVATYGRSLYALAIGLFCGRWTLMALGEVDYGLMGVVGGLVGFLGFLNGIMSGAIGRFFAVAIGEEQSSPQGGLEKCRMWFTTALVGTCIWPTVVVLIGYPIGEWAILNYLNIPPDRVSACVWVWRFVCTSFWASVVLAPFNAMYGAKQYIAELTIYSFVTSTLNVCFVYYMLKHPGVWLAKFSLWTCVLSIIPSMIIAARASWIFPECRIVKRHLACWGNLKKMLSFSGWNMISWFGGVLANQGCMVLVNKSFGPAANAGVNIGTNLSGHAQTLGGSLIGAFSPAIMNAYGAGDYERMEELVYWVDKIGTLCILIFAIPLALEVDEVLILWLKDPPAYAAGCCILALAHTVIDKLSIGNLIAINAKGVIAKFQMLVGSCWLAVLPMAYFFVKIGGGVYSALMALILARGYSVLARVWFARKLLGMGARRWILEVLFPLSLITTISCLIGLIPSLFMPSSFLRICVTTLAVEIVLLPLSWFLLLNVSERGLLLRQFRTVFGRFAHE